MLGKTPNSEILRNSLGSKKKVWIGSGSGYLSMPADNARQWSDLGQIKRRSFKARLLASNDNSIHMARRRKPVVDTGVVVVVTIVVVEVVATVVVEVGGASVSTDGGGLVSWRQSGWAMVKIQTNKKKHTQINTNTSTKKPRADRHSPPRCHCRCHYRFHRHFRFHCHCHFHCHFPLEYKMLNIEYKKLPLPLPLSSRIQNMKYKKANMICDMSLWMQNKEYKC